MIDATRYLADQDNEWNRLLCSDPLSLHIDKSVILREYSELFKKILPKNEQFKALEVGCGTGLWLWYFNKFFSYTVYGIDILASAVELANRNLQHLGVRNRNLIRKNFLTYDNADFFDFVYSFGTIEHFQDPVIFLNKCDSLLKKGGHLLVEVPHFSFINKAIMRMGQSRTRYKRYLDVHNVAILSLNKFKRLINSTLGGSYETLYLDTAGIFDVTVYNISAFQEPARYKKMRERIYASGKILKFLRLKSISPGLIFIGKKK